MKALFLCVAAIAAFAAPEAARSSAAPLAEIKLEPYRKGVAVRVVANGKPGLFMFDTAAGLTVVSPKYAAATGCKPWGQLVGHQMTGNKLTMARCDNFGFKVGSVDLVAPVAGVFDVAPLVAKDAEPFEGLLALDVFDGQVITVDAAAGKLTVESPASMAEAIRGAREIPVKIAREVGGSAMTVFAQVPTPQGPIGLEIDTGNGGTILVSKPYAKLLGIDPDGGPQKASFQVAEGVQAEGLVFAPELLIDGNLGMPFIKDWAITLDLKAARMWIKRSRATPPPGMGVPPPLPAK